MACYKCMIVISIVIAVLAVFFAGDADLPLLFLSTPSDAYLDKVVWITGASSGIGAVLAQEMVRHGAKVVISARRVDQLNDVASKCSGRHAPVAIPLDVTDAAAQEEAYAEVVKRVGPVDILVLNAGRSQRMTAVATSLDLTKELFNLNFFAVVQLAKLVLPSMIDRRSGQIVLVSSLSGRMGTPLGSSYSATKFAMHGYFDALRAEVADKNITVSIVCPGPVESEIATKTIRDPTKPASVEGKKMTTLRCVDLMLRGMAHRVEEMWISDQPFLTFTYLSTYAPWVSRQIMKFVGPIRAKILEEGGNVYDVKAAFGLK